MSVYEIVLSGIEAQIGADKLKEEYGSVIDEVVENITEVMLSSAPTLRVAGADRPREVVCAQFSRLRAAHAEAAIWGLRNRAAGDITDIKAYMRTLLYNSLFTLDSEISHKAAQQGY